MFRKTVFVILLIMLFNFSPGGAFAELVAYYPMNESAGVDILDATNYGHNGTASAEPSRIDSREGFGRALLFGNEADAASWVNCGTWNPSENTGQLTIAFWVNWNGPDGNWQGVVAKRNSYEPSPDGSMMWYFEISQGVNDIFFGRRDQTPASGGVLPIGVWKHIAVTCDGTTATMYIDAKRVSGGAFTFGPTEDAAILIGCDELGGSNAFNGAIDEVRLYNTALKWEEIETAMFETTAPVELAFSPDPYDKAVEVPRDAVLSWRPGVYADSHNVYLGTDAAGVNDATVDNPMGVLVAQNTQQTSYDPLGLMDYSQTYYWRVDEVSNTNPDSPWKGTVWSFKTVEYIVVEDFEDYNDYPPHEIWNTWIDGYDDPSNGSMAGYPGPDFNAGEHYMEDTIVHSGQWSMPLIYYNTAGLSEVVRTLDTPLDWTKAEDELRAVALWFCGDPGNAAEPLYFGVADTAGNTKVIAHPNPNAVQLEGWHDFNIALSDFTDAGVNIAAVKKLYIGLGNRANPVAGGNGSLFVDDIRVCQRRCVPSMAKSEYDLNNDCIVNEADLAILMEDYGRTSVQPQDVAEVVLEAEAADTISAPMGIQDDPDASGGRYITVEPGNGSSSSPPFTGIATYNINISGGTYVVYCRTIAPTGNDDSFWFLINGATTQTNNHSSGWIRWDVLDSTDWNWGPVQSMDDGNAKVEFTMAAGTYTLEIAYREDGALLDSILITDNLGFDPAVFEPLDNDFNKDGVIDDADVALMMEHWLDEILWP